MANTDQNITELPIKTASEVADADYLMGIDLVEGYQVLTKDFADYVVNEAEITVGGKKQTTANAISEIGTTASNAQPKESGKGLSTNDYTTAEKNKLSGIASGAEVNQNAFSNVKVGNTTIAADGKTDTLEIVAGSNISLTPDATNDKVTISGNYSNATTNASGLMSAEDKSKLNGIASGAEVNVNADWNATSGDAQILHKPTTVAGYGITDAYTKTEIDEKINPLGLSVVNGRLCVTYLKEVEE